LNTNTCELLQIYEYTGQCVINMIRKKRQLDFRDYLIVFAGLKTCNVSQSTYIYNQTSLISPAK